MLKQQETKRSPDSRDRSDAESNLYRYRLDIDGLRGISVIAVLVFHASKSLMPSGLRGVDVFFVISGYVVTASVLRHQSKTLSSYFIDFYKRRILRLMPALLVCLLITTIAGGLLIRPDSFVPTLEVGRSALIGWANNTLISSGSDYFGLETELSPFTHTWSLGVEEQFYFIFPIILAAVYGLRRRPVQNKKIAVLVLTTLAVASGLLFIYLNSTDPLKAYYFMPGRFWQMASGALLFAMLTAWPSIITLFQRQRWLSYATQLCAVLLLGMAFTYASPQRFSPSIGTAIATSGTLSFIVAGLNQNSFLNRSVAQPVWTYLGKISYSLYLWHWPVFVLSRWTIGMNSPLTVCLTLCVTFALTLLSYYLIEQPMRKMKALPYRSVFAIALAGILTVGTTSVAVAQTALDGDLYLYRAYDNKDWEATREERQVAGSQISRTNCAVKQDSFSPPVLAEQFEACTYAAKDPSSPHLFLIGDSHAESTLPMLGEVVKETDIGVTTLFSVGCFVSLDMLRPDEKYQKCPLITSSLLALIEEKAKANDIVMNVSYYAVLNGGQGINRVQNPDIFRFSKPGEVIPTASVYGQLEKELTEISQRLARKGVRLIVQAPLPEYRAKAEQCVPTWFGAKSGLNADCFTERSLNLDYRQKLMNALKAVQQQTDSFYVWDVFDELCPERMCSHFEQGKPLFFDDDHLSVYGSKSLSSNFVSFLKTQSLL